MFESLVQNRNALKEKMRLGSFALTHAGPQMWGGGWHYCVTKPSMPAGTSHRDPIRSTSFCHEQTQAWPGASQPACKFLNRVPARNLPWLIGLNKDVGNLTIERQMGHNTTPARGLLQRCQGHRVMTGAVLCVCLYFLSNRKTYWLPQQY